MATRLSGIAQQFVTESKFSIDLRKLKDAISDGVHAPYVYSGLGPKTTKSTFGNVTAQKQELMVILAPMTPSEAKAKYSSQLAKESPGITLIIDDQGYISSFAVSNMKKHQFEQGKSIGDIVNMLNAYVKSPDFKPLRESVSDPRGFERGDKRVKLGSLRKGQAFYFPTNAKKQPCYMVNPKTGEYSVAGDTTSFRTSKASPSGYVVPLSNQEVNDWIKSSK